MKNIGNQRECFFDEEMLDMSKTTAQFRLHEPILRETVLVHDAPWEGDGCDYHNFFFDDSWKGVNGEYENGCYRMYYVAWDTPKGLPEQADRHYLTIVICYAESPDALHWVKPSLEISEWEGSKDNNIILGLEENNFWDNFMVFRDTNPACPDDERYKGICAYDDRADKNHRVLFSFFSADGIHFRPGVMLTDKGMFDTLNVAFWDEKEQIYRAYLRNFHDIPNGDLNAGKRDIRYMESKDFRSWSEPVLLDFKGGEDYPLYTNVVQPYFRAPQMYIGFPTRYIERHEWNGNYDELCGKEMRLMRMKVHPRLGLAVTDCCFMCSRDGRSFKRYERAFIRPNIENGYNWVYGDCYPARGFAVTHSAVRGAPDELSMFIHANHFMNIPSELQRYTLRLDGFVSLCADAEEEIITTIPFVYDGGNLYVNFSTSAKGYIYFTLRSGDEEYTSCETFGNTTDRRVHFDDNAVQKLAGKEVTMTIRMSDADIYSFRFGD